MNIEKLFTLILFFCAISRPGVAQQWELEMETEEGIQIFTRFVEGEPLKQVKIEFEIKTALNPLVSLITNPDKYTDFVYKSLTYQQKSGEPGNGIFYGQLDFPWPLSDRDFIVSTKTEQDPITKQVIISTKSVDQSAYSLESGFVRINSHHNTWKLIPGDHGMVKGEYWLKSDPSGTIPQWCVNMMIHEGSVKTIQQLFIELAGYQSHNPIAFIKEK